MIVLDASAAVELILATPSAGARLRERLYQDGAAVHVPHLFDLEVLNALRGLDRAGNLSAQSRFDSFANLATLRLIRYPHWSFRQRIWDLRDRLSAYDAAYVALSEKLKMPLLTCDARLANAPNLDAVVELYT